MIFLINSFVTKNLLGLTIHHIFQQKDRLTRSVSSMSGVLVGVCQMTAGSDMEKNIDSCKKLIDKAKTRGAKVC